MPSGTRAKLPREAKKEQQSQHSMYIISSQSVSSATISQARSLEGGISHLNRAVHIFIMAFNILTRACIPCIICRSVCCHLRDHQNHWLFVSCTAGEFVILCPTHYTLQLPMGTSSIFPDWHSQHLLSSFGSPRHRPLSIIRGLSHLSTSSSSVSESYYLHPSIVIHYSFLLVYIIVSDKDFRGQSILHFNLFQLLCDCSTIAPPPTYAVVMSLYQIISN